MSENTPQQAASADAVGPVAGELLAEPRSRPVGNGWSWIADGFGLFKKNVGLWIGMVLVYMVIMFVLSIVPLVNILLSLLVPVFTGGFMVVCHRADKEGSFDFADMFAGFQKQTGPLVILGLLYFGFTILIMLIMGILMAISGGWELFMSVIGASSPEAMPASMGIRILVWSLVSMLLFTLLAMAMWFAPPLVILNKVPPWNAFKMSFQGCLKNVIPFLIYGIVLFVFAILAMIPFALGLLILMPIAIGSLYVGYKDIFIQE